MQEGLDPKSEKPPRGGGPYALACEKLWRLTEELALRHVGLEIFLNRFVENFSYLESLPNVGDVPNSCRGLLSSVAAKIDSKWTTKEIPMRGHLMPQTSFDGFDDDEAREIAKSIVDLTYAVTLENAAHLGRERSP